MDIRDEQERTPLHFAVVANRISVIQLLIKSGNSLRKQAYSNTLKILQPKHENFQVKNPDIFHISAQKYRLWDALELPW